MKIKETLYTPKTDFSMRANASQNEPLVIDKWKKEMLYERLLERNKSKDPYYIHFGPPYANGQLHIGHGLNILLKDFCHRIALQQDKYAPMIIGWDTHGLPIEHAILKKKKASLGDSWIEFRSKCRDYAKEQVALQKIEMKRLGVLSNLDNHYLTMNKEYEANQLDLFFNLMENGYVYRANKPIIWSWSSRSALAEAEVEYKDVESDSIFVLMKVISTDFKGETYALTWTTTPWTIPSNKAISFSSKQLYVIAKDKSKRNIILAKEAFDRLHEKLNLKMVEEISSNRLVGQRYISPLTNEECPFLSGSHVEVGQGTGLVHTAPAHGKDDYLVGKEHKIEIVSGVDERGHLLHENYKDVFYKKANNLIIDDLLKMNLLLHKETYKHSYPMDWRTGKPIIYMATTQWFINVNKAKKNIINSLKETKFYQPWAKKRIIGMFERRDDWCISRQRKWGVPIAIYYDENGEPIINKALFKAIKDIFLEKGSDVYYEKDFEEQLIFRNKKLESILKKASKKEHDIMDVWLDSGVSHYTVMDKQFNVQQSDLYLEGIDQFRGWFNSSIVTGVMYKKQAPYKSISTHGFIVDANGNKMSKSKGNGMKLDEVIKNYGIEVYRLFVATVDYSDNVRISKEILNQVADQYKKIRNVFRFLLANLNGFKNEQLTNTFRPIDLYMIHKINDLIETVDINFSKINFTNAVRAINSFMVNEVSSLYLDISKDTLYVKEWNNLRRRQILTIFSFIVDRLSRLLWPVLPILIDDVQKHFPFSNEDMTKNVSQASLIKLPQDYVGLISDVEKLLIFRKKFLHDADELIKAGTCKKTNEITCKIKNQGFIEDFELSDIKEVLQCAEVIVDNKVAKNLDDDKDDVQYKISVNKELIKCNRCWQFVPSKNKTELIEDDKTISICFECKKVLDKDFPKWK